MLKKKILVNLLADSSDSLGEGFLEHGWTSLKHFVCRHPFSMGGFIPWPRLILSRWNVSFRSKQLVKITMAVTHSGSSVFVSCVYLIKLLGQPPAVGTTCSLSLQNVFLHEQPWGGGESPTLGVRGPGLTCG